MNEEVLFFKIFPFELGQKIHIEDGPRKGDWEVVGIDEKKIKLRCPVSGFEANWDRFCYFAEKRSVEWPAED